MPIIIISNQILRAPGTQCTSFAHKRCATRAQTNARSTTERQRRSAQAWPRATKNARSTTDASPPVRRKQNTTVPTNINQLMCPLRTALQSWCHPYQHQSTYVNIENTIQIYVPSDLICIKCNQCHITYYHACAHGPCAHRLCEQRWLRTLPSQTNTRRVCNA